MGNGGEAASANRLPVVGVLGSGSRADAGRCGDLGRWLAGQQVHLLTGGGGGAMAEVSRAFAGVRERRGLVIGIIPGPPGGEAAAARSGYPNPWVELAIATHLPLSGSRGTQPLSRNHLNVLTSDVLVALPGGAGTASEVELALRYQRPLVAWLDRRDAIPGLPDAVRVTSELAEVQAFVCARLARQRS